MILSIEKFPNEDSKISWITSINYINEECLIIIRRRKLARKVFKVIELIGTSPSGWEEAAKDAIDAAFSKLTNIRIAEIVELDTTLENGKIVEYRAKIRLSFKVEREPETL